LYPIHLAQFWPPAPYPRSTKQLEAALVGGCYAHIKYVNLPEWLQETAAATARFLGLILVANVLDAAGAGADTRLSDGVAVV